MDVAAGIAGLVALADLVFSKVFWYIKAARNAEKDVTVFSTEIRTLSGILHSLHLVACQLEGEEYDQAIRVHHIYYCHETLELVKARLQRAFPQGQSISTGKTFLSKLKWPYTASETKNLIEDIQRHKTTLSLALSADTLSSLLKALGRQQVIESSLEEFKSESCKRWDREDRKNVSAYHRRVLVFFSPVDPQRNHEMSLKLRQPGTGLWLTESPEFIQWISSNNSRLWLYGIPGAGKTVLASLAIEETMNKCSRESTVAYFYCDYRNFKSHSPVNILGSIATQIARQNQQCFEKLSAYYDKCNPDDSLPKFPNERFLRDIIGDMAKHFDDVAILVDGLDECGEMTVEVVKLLDELSTTTPNIKTLLLSRDEPHIRDQLEHHAQISIAARNSDLKLYVASEIELRIRTNRLRLRSNELKEHIMDKLVNSAEGMFRWVACQIDYLCELPNDRERRRALNTLPPGLDATYERILERLNDRPIPSRRIARRTLKWLMYSPAQLTASALCQAISVDIGDKDLDSESIPPEDEILRCCSSLVRLAPHGYELAHFTVKEFLSRLDAQHYPKLSEYCMDEENSTLHLSSICLTYLNFEGFEKGSVRNLDEWYDQEKQYAFKSHAVEHWGHYWRSRWSNESTRMLVQLLFNPVASENLLSLMQHYFWVVFPMIQPGEQTKNVEFFIIITRALKTLGPLHFAAILLEYELCKWLMESNCRAMQNSDLGQPLHLAILGSVARYSIYSHIVGRGSLSAVAPLRLPPPPPPPPFSSPKSPLPLSSGMGPSTSISMPTPEDNFQLRYNQIIELFVGENTDSESHPSMFGHTTLELAASRGSQLLIPILKAGVKIDEQFLLYLERRLIDYDSWRYDTIQTLDAISVDQLSEAARRHFSKLCLITNYIDSKGSAVTEIQGIFSGDKKEQWDALTQAVKYDHIETVRAFLKQGNMDLGQCAQSKELNVVGTTLLHIAAAFGSSDLVRCLLEFGANPNQADDDGRTPLHLSSYDSTGLKARILLEEGSRHEVSDSQGWTSWHFASATCNHEMLVILAKIDANPRGSLAKTGLGALTPIHTFGAVASGSSLKWHPTVKNALQINPSHYVKALALILQLGADPRYLAENGSTVLHQWLDQGFLSSDCIKLLLDNGIDPSIVRQDGKTALHLLNAPKSVNLIELEQIVRLLLPNSAKSITDKDGRLPIHSLCCSFTRMHVPTFDTFVALGTDPTIKDKYGHSCFELVLGLAEEELLRPSISWRSIEDSFSLIVAILNTLKQVDLSALYVYSSRVYNVACRLTRNWSVLALLDKGFPVDHYDISSSFGSYSGLQSACMYCPSTLVHKMLSQSTNPPPCSGAGLVSFACRGNNDTNTLAMLLDLGLDPNEPATLDDKTPLIWAAVNGKSTHVKLLLERGALPGIVDEKGRSALHQACICGQDSIVEILLASCLTNSSTGGAPVNRHKLSCAIAEEPNEDWENDGKLLVLDESERPAKNNLHYQKVLDVDAKTKSGHTALHDSVSLGRKLCAKHLLASGADVAVESSIGENALYCAASIGDVDLIRLILEYGGGYDIKDSSSRNPYLAALRGGHGEVARILLDDSLQKVSNGTNTEGIKPEYEQKVSLSSGLGVAIQTDDLELCSSLIALGVDIDLPISSSSGGCRCGVCTPLIIAFRQQSYSVAGLIIEKGAKLQEQTCHSGGTKGYTPFHFAVLNGCPTNLHLLLLERVPGPSFHASAVHPIHMAIATYNHDALDRIFRYFVKHHSLELASSEKYDGIDDRVRKSLASIVETRVQIENLHWTWSLTGEFGYLDTDDINGYLNIDDINGYLDTDDINGTPLHVAAWADNAEAANVLITHGAIIDSTNSLRETPLHVAATEVSLEALKVLIEHGANPNARNKYLVTPTMMAFNSYIEHTIATLQQAGADFSIPDSQGRTSLWYALSSGKPSALLAFKKDRFSLHIKDYNGCPYVQHAFSITREMDTYFLNEDFDLNACTRAKGNIFQKMSRDITGALKRVIRRLPSNELHNLMDSHGESWHSALYLAASEGLLQNVAFLLDAGATIELTGGPHGTPLMAACHAGNIEAVKLLVRSGAKTNYANEIGETISGVLLARHHPSVISWLLVGRYVEQGRVCQHANEGTEAKVTMPWSGFQTVELSTPRLYGISQLKYLRELNQLRQRYLGTVYVH